MARPQINERDQYPVRITIKDADGVASTPSTLRYRVDCLTSQTEVLSWASVSAASVVDITIAASANVIVNPTINALETKRITVQANAGTDAQLNKYHEYDVVNNEFYA